MDRVLFAAIMVQAVYNMSDELDRILPSLGNFLEAIQPISPYFPVCCEDSSIILNAWLIKNGLNNKIMIGYYPDPVIGKKKGKTIETPHFWVMTDNYIIDGAAVQFTLNDYEKRSYTCAQLRTQISRTKFAYALNTKNYKKCVEAYIPQELDAIIDILVRDTRESFRDFMEDARRILQDHAESYYNAKQYFIYTSGYKLDSVHSKLTRSEIVEKYCNAGMTEVHYIRNFNV